MANFTPFCTPALTLSPHGIELATRKDIAEIIMGFPCQDNSRQSSIWGMDIKIEEEELCCGKSMGLLEFPNWILSRLLCPFNSQ